MSELTELVHKKAMDKEKQIRSDERAKIKSLIAREEYCQHCIWYDTEEMECDFKEHRECDPDSMERAIVRMLEGMD